MGLVASYKAQLLFSSTIHCCYVGLWAQGFAAVIYLKRYSHFYMLASNFKILATILKRVKSVWAKSNISADRIKAISFQLLTSIKIFFL